MDRLALERQLATLLFSRMATWCATRNVQLTVLTTGWPWGGGYPWLGEVLRHDDIYFQDLRSEVADVIGADLEKYSIAGDGHPNERGAVLIERAAWPVLERRLANLLPK